MLEVKDQKKLQSAFEWSHINLFNLKLFKNKGQNSLCPVCEASFKSGQESIFL